MNIPPKEVYCHRTGFAKSCRALVTSGKCNRWVTLEGSDPVNGQPMSKSDCVDNWPIMLLIELARKIANGTAGVQAATESFRNEMLRLNGVPVDVRKLPMSTGLELSK